MFVAISRFTIANDMVAQMRDAFRNRPRLVEAAPGFVRMEIMSPCDQQAEVWLVTYWQDNDSYQAWHGSDAYRESHKAIPKGLKLIPKSAEIRMFDLFAD